MKKLIALALAAVMAFSMVACGGDDKKEPTGENVGTEIVSVIEGETKEEMVADMTAAIDAVYAENELETIGLMTMEVDLTDAEMTKYLTGIEDPAKLQAAVISESMTGSIPYSFIIVKVADGVNAEEVKNEMKANIDMRKWICVEANTTWAAHWDDAVVFIMANTNLEPDLTVSELADSIIGVFGEPVNSNQVLDVIVPEEVIEGDVAEGEVVVDGAETVVEE